MDRELFSLERSQECLRRISDACDGYTLMERWYALRCLEVSARALLGEKVMEFVREEGLAADSELSEGESAPER